MLRAMLTVPLFMCLIACGTTSDGKPRATLTTSATDLTVYCPRDWADCYQQARDACGTAGFTESRVPGQSGVSTAGGQLGSGTSRTEEIYRRAAGRESPTERRLTFRCRE